MFRRLARAIRARPARSALVAAGLLLLAAAVGYGYALYEWRQAGEAIKGARLGEARRRLDRCLLVWPRSPAVRLRAARAAWMQGDFVAAEAHLNRCLSLQGGASEATQLEFLLMRAFSGELGWEVTEPLFNLVLAEHPESRFILETLARSYMQKQHFGLAYHCLSRLLQSGPSAKVYLWRGWVLERLNSPKSALEDYLKAIEADPGFVPARLRVAEVYLDDKKPVEALTHLELLHKQEPNRPDVMARLGQCRFLQGQRQEARRLMEAALEQMPDDPALLIHLARLDVQEGRAKDAEARMLQLLKASPSDVEAHFVLVQVYGALRRRADAAEALRRYNELKDRHDRVNRLLKDEAERPSTEAERAYRIGKLKMGLGEEAVGVHWLKEALSRDPGHEGAHRALAEYYEKTGDRDGARYHRSRLGAAKGGAR